MNLTRRGFVQNVGKISLALAASRVGSAAFRSAASGQPAAEPLKARLEIDPERRLGSIDPNLYGNFVEHLGRCIYGGIYDEGSRLSDADGIRKDVLDAAHRLRVTQLRWPGGNFVSGYANRSGGIALDVLNLSPRFETRNFGEQNYLDVSATYDEGRRRVCLAVVNRRKEGDVLGKVELQGVQAKPGGRAFVITGASPESENTFEKPRAVSMQEVKLAASGSNWEYSFPRHSITWLEFDLEA